MEVETQQTANKDVGTIIISSGERRPSVKTQMEVETLVNIDEDILRLMKQHGRPVSFRDLTVRLPDSIGAQEIWDTLRRLQTATIIEDIKISNKKRRWQIQHWYASDKQVEDRRKDMKTFLAQLFWTCTRVLSLYSTL